MTTPIEIIYDIEVYQGRVGIILNVENKIFFIDTLEGIRKLPLNDKKYLWIGFNNRRYDHPILDTIAQGASFDDAFKLSKSIIHGGKDVISWNQNIVDLYEICPKMARCSLKEIGHRLGYPILQNLPYPFDRKLTDEEWGNIGAYARHDEMITRYFWSKLKNEYYARQSLKLFFDIKTEYGGAPNLAQKAILSKLGSGKISNGKELIRQSNLKLSPIMQGFYDAAFKFGIDNYMREIDNTPEFMADKHDVNGCLTKFGVGGLHGNTYSGVYNNIYEYDVVSYYPSIILKCQLGSPEFRAIYKEIYDHRVKLKAKGDKRADALKLVLNSLYGKLTCQYAKPPIHAPEIALSICLLGQFYLVDLMEKLNYEQCLVANTDGIMCDSPIPDSIIKEWETRTGFKLTLTKYKKMIIKDVNSYYAIDERGKEKRKKEFLTSRFTHNVRAPIVQHAVVKKLLDGIPIENTIMQCDELYDFCFFAKAKKENKLLLNGVGIDDPQVRYYAATTGYTLERKTDKVTTKLIKDSKIQLAMNLKPIDNDTHINYDWYIESAKKLEGRVLKNQKVYG